MRAWTLDFGLQRFFRIRYFKYRLNRALAKNVGGWGLGNQIILVAMRTAYNTAKMANRTIILFQFYLRIIPLFHYFPFFAVVCFFELSLSELLAPFTLRNLNCALRSLNELIRRG